MRPSRYSNDEYSIGWISALSEEFIVAMAMLDEEHGRPQSTPRDDTNAYHLGRIGEHNIAMACLSGGQMGTGPAAIVAENMRRTFKNIRFALLVGIGGGVPSEKKDVRLGDVVVSYPDGIYTGIVQYDYGKLKNNGDIERKDWFCAPPRKILAAVDLLKAYHTRPKNPMNNMSSIIDELGEEYAYPAEHETPDLLYQADYDHDSEIGTCDSCDKGALIPRRARRSPSKPNIHYGIIASGSMVIRTAVERDKINQRYGNSIFCFDMEAAGLMNNFPCLVIRGISDYSDSHKNDKWRNRAAAVASAYAKELLLLVEPSDIEILPPIAARVLDTVSRNIAKIDESMTENTRLLKQAEEESHVKHLRDLQIQCERWLKPPNVRQIQQDRVRERLPRTCDWIWSNTMFTKWNSLSPLSPLEGLICIYGPPGCGKSILASSIVDNMWGNKMRALFFAFSGVDANRQKIGGLVRSLLWQLLEVAPGERTLSIFHSFMLRGQPTTSDLWMAFRTIATFVTEPVYCVIDGVDENKDGVDELVQQLHIFLQDHSNFRFIMLGRQHSFRAIDSIRHTLEIDPILTNVDVDIVIETGIARSDILNKSQLRDKVFQTLREQSNGNFLWIKLMIGHLDKSVGVHDALERLRNLPRDLQTAYEDLFWRLICRLELSELCLARKVLSFIIVAQRPLSLDEFQHLLAADAMSTSASKDHSIEDYLISRPDHRILDVCGDIVSIIDGYLHPVHFSIIEFLVRPEEQWLHHRKSRKIMRVFRVHIKDAHGSLTTACAEYLETICYSSSPQDWDNSPEIVKHYHLLDYLFGYLTTHINRSYTKRAFIVNKIDRFLNSNRCITLLEHAATKIIADESLESQADEFDKFTSWLDDGYPGRLLGKVLARLKDEHERRSREYGQNDLRTERIRLFLCLVQDAAASTTIQPVDLCTERSAEESNEILPILQILRNDAPLFPHLKVDLLLRMRIYLQKVRRLTDPLQILFRIILQKASRVPIYALLQVADFYLKVHKYDHALEIYFAAFNKVKGREVRVEFKLLFLIGITYDKMKQYEKTLEFFEKALAGQERLLGPEHEDTLTTLHRMGYVCYELQQYEKALEFFIKALAGRQKVLGSEHTSTLRTLHWMSCVYYKLREYEKSLEFLTKTLAGQEKILGSEHEETLITLHWMGCTYYSLCQYEKALELFTKALAGKEKVLQSNHENTLITLHWMGRTYYSLYQYEKALELFTKALIGREKVLGFNHKDTLTTLHWISFVYYKLKEYERSLEFLTKALAGKEKVLGSEHAMTLRVFQDIGCVYYSLQKYEMALEFFTKALIGQEKVLGCEHEDTLTTLHCIDITRKHYSPSQETWELQFDPSADTSSIGI